jgi:hypothetical protein
VVEALKQFDKDPFEVLRAAGGDLHRDTRSLPVQNKPVVPKKKAPYDPWPAPGTPTREHEDEEEAPTPAPAPPAAAEARSRRPIRMGFDEEDMDRLGRLVRAADRGQVIVEK